MITVKELISQLEKMPEDMNVLLNFNKEGSTIKVHFDDIKVEKHKFDTPWSKKDEKAEFVVLNQVPIV